MATTKKLNTEKAPRLDLITVVKIESERKARDVVGNARRTQEWFSFGRSENQRTAPIHTADSAYY